MGKKTTAVEAFTEGTEEYLLAAWLIDLKVRLANYGIVPLISETSRSDVCFIPCFPLYTLPIRTMSVGNHSPLDVTSP